MKICSHCRQEKTYSEFSKYYRANDGRQKYCKDCAKIAFKKWYQANINKQRKNALDYYNTHREKSIGGMRQRYWRNPEKARARSREATKKVQDKSNAWHKKRRREHPEIFKAHRAVKKAVQKGELPPQNERACNNCGQMANQYHHYLGYKEENWLNVAPLCYKCHGKEKRVTF